jgi:hypothetical protein
VRPFQEVDRDADAIQDKMGQGMRLIVGPGGINGGPTCLLVPDKRFCELPEELVPSDACAWLSTNQGLGYASISPLPEYTDPDILSGKRGGKLGWRDSGLVDVSKVPHGGTVWGVTQ